MDKTRLKDLEPDALQAHLENMGQPRFRARQIEKWLFQRNAAAFDEMTDLPAGLRTKLAAEAAIDTLEHVQNQESPSGDARKFLFRLHDGQLIETVLMYYGDRTTLCVSTQVGCPIDCKFCATGLMGLKRNLTRGEILDQFLMAQRISGDRISNLVVMGMGEPMLNYDTLMSALDVLTSEQGPNLSNQHVVVSTSGLIPKIERFTEERRKYKLAISLNATTDEVRDDIMPLNKKWPIADLIAAAKSYTNAMRRRVTFEYVLLAGINDSDEDAKRLRTLLRDLNCKLNLIPFNYTYSIYRRPENAVIERFYKQLAGLPFPVTIRWSKGTDIDAACGQLVTRQKDEILRNAAKRGVEE